MTPEFNDEHMDAEVRQMERRAAAEAYAEGIAKMLNQITGEQADPASAELFKRGMAETLCPTPPPMAFPGMPAMPKLPKVRPHLFVFAETVWDWCNVTREFTFAEKKTTGQVVVHYREGPPLCIDSIAGDDLMAWLAEQRKLYAAMPGQIVHVGSPR